MNLVLNGSKLIGLTLIGLFLCAITTQAQSYISSQAGPWDDPATWGGVSPVPDASNSTSILIDHAVTIPSGLSVNADQLTIGTGSLTVSSGGTFTLADGTGTDLTISTGSLSVGGTFICNNLATTSGTTAVNSSFASGSEYRHLYTTTPGALITASWDPNSTIRLTGFTSGVTLASTTWTQTIGNVVFDCPALGGSFNFGGLIRSVAGDFTITNSNTRSLTLVTTASPTINIGGSFTIASAQIPIVFSASSVTATYNVAQNFNYSTTTSNSLASLGNATMNIGGHFTMNTTATLNLTTGGSAFNGTLDVKGNFTLTAGTITEANSGTGRGVIRFTGTGAQTFSRTGGVLPLGNAAPMIDWFFAAGSTVNLGTSIISSGIGSFTTVHGTIGVGATDGGGALQNNITGGNIQTPTAGRSFTSTAAIVYNGVSPQSMGSIYHNFTGVDAVISNSSGVTQIASVTIGGDLVLQSGNLTTGTNNSLTVNGNLSLPSGSLTSGNLNIGSNATLTLNGNSTNNANNYITFQLFSNLIINGTGVFGVFPFQAGSTPSFGNLTVNRTSSGSVTFDNDVSIIGNTTLTEGNLIFNGRKLTLNGTFSSVLGLLTSDSTSSLEIVGSGNTGTLLFTPGSALNTLSINKTGGGTVALGTAINVTTALDLLGGTLNNNSGITFSDNATITRDDDSEILITRLTNSPGESYNVVYVGSVPYLTGLELPDPSDDEDLNNLTINGPVTLNQDLIISGTMNLDAETFQAGAFEITMEGPAWLDNNGAFDPGSGLVIFTDNTFIDGVSPMQLGNIQIASGAVVDFPTADINISGDIDVVTGGTLNSNNGLLVLNGAADQTVSASGTEFNNITVDKTNDSDVILTTPMNLSGLLQILSQNTNFASNGNLTLLSVADNISASIGPLLIGTSVSGNVQVQRFMSGEGRIWRYIASPVTNANVSDLMDNFPITGPFADPSTGPGLISANRSFYFYNESATGGLQNGWIGYPVSGSASSSPLVPGVGYSAFIREDIGPTVWDVAGPVNQGPFDFTSLSYTNSGNVLADGWNLLGNPYPSTILWGDVGWTKTNIAEPIAIRDNGTGTFQYWDGQLGGDTVFFGQIAMGQAFWVRANGAGPDLQIDETAKSTSNSLFFKTSTVDYLEVTLTKGTDIDRAYFRQRDTALEGIDRFDAPKMSNDYFSLSIRSSDNYTMAISAVNKIPCGGKIQLDLVFAKNANGSFVKSPVGQYKLFLSQFGLFGSNQVELYDKFTGTKQIFQPDQPYIFNITSSSQSYRADRFELQLNEQVPSTKLTISGAGVVCSDPAAVIVENAQPDVEYQAFINDVAVSELKAGLGQNLTLEIPSDSISLGISVVRIKAINGCNTYYLVNSISIQKEDHYQITSFASTQACQQGSVTITVAGAPDNAMYKWFETESSNTSVAQTASPDFQTPELNKPKTYFVSIVNSLGCEGPRTPVHANIVNYDDVAITSPRINELESNYAEGNTWYLNSSLLPQNSQVIKIQESGIYRVEVSINGCVTSDEQEYIVTGIGETLPDVFGVYPNPVADVLTLTGNVDPEKVNMVNATGAKVNLTWINEDDAWKLWVKDLQSGIYYISAIEGNRIKTLKVIKK